MIGKQNSKSGFATRKDDPNERNDIDSYSGNSHRNDGKDDVETRGQEYCRDNVSCIEANHTCGGGYYGRGHGRCDGYGRGNGYCYNNENNEG